MSDWMYSFISLDMLPLIAGVLSAVCCGLLGNHLVLRQQSLMGDAISHAVLPGLVMAFLISGTRNPAIMFIGAAGSAVVTVILIQIVRKLGRVEPGAAMGVIFSVLFALGVLLLEQAAARSVDLDASCVLYGQLETLFWFPPNEYAELLSLQSASQVPRQIWTLLGMTIAVILFVGVFFKELRISAFDPGISSAQGINAGAMQFILMIFVAAASVASFEAVGSILVIAMLICPAATARLLTDRMGSQILVSAAVAITSAISGYVLAANVPDSLVRGGSVNAAGMMAVMNGVLLVSAVFFSPSHGTIAKGVRRRSLQKRIALEDLLSTLFRIHESGQKRISISKLESLVGIRRAVSAAITGNLVDDNEQGLALTELGNQRASGLIRKHRLWEGYLVEQGGMLVDHVHPIAEQLEHLDDPIPGNADAPSGDQHGKPIPPAS
jgi:manganese/zinc/iron transport system permease protein